MHIEILGDIELGSEFDKNPPDRDNPTETQTAESERRGRQQKILVVDESWAWLRLAREILIQGGYQVSVCEHPYDALWLFRENSQEIDLVITELQMRYLNGIELAAELLKINSAVPVVLTSAAEVGMTTEKLQSLGIRDFLTKPCERERLLSVVRKVLASTGSEDS